MNETLSDGLIAINYKEVQNFNYYNHCRASRKRKIFARRHRQGKRSLLPGRLRQALFLKAFEDAGFYGIRIVKRDEKHWQVIEGIEFRAVTVEA